MLFALEMGWSIRIGGSPLLRADKDQNHLSIASRSFANTTLLFSTLPPNRKICVLESPGVVLIVYYDNYCLYLEQVEH
jgi:hypothetical protein